LPKAGDGRSEIGGGPSEGIGKIEPITGQSTNVLGISFPGIEPMKTQQEIKTETRRIRERARELSGFWTSELAAATYALEWVLEKRPAPPSSDIGSPASGLGKIAEALVKAAERPGKPERTPRPKGPRRIPPAK
jgi:hypothetical protein